MKGTQAFQEAISLYLSGRAALDPLFAQRYCNPEKKIEDCITYILNEVQKSGINGFTDDEIYSLALHYYMEDALDPGNPISCQVIVNHQVELTAEEIEEMKDKARKEVFDREAQRLRTVGKHVPTQKQETEQLSLF